VGCAGAGCWPAAADAVTDGVGLAASLPVGEPPVAVGLDAVVSVGDVSVGEGLESVGDEEAESEPLVLVPLVVVAGAVVGSEPPPTRTPTEVPLPLAFEIG